MKRNTEPSLTDCPICRRRVIQLISSIGIDRALRPSDDRSLPSIFGVNQIAVGQGDPIGGEVEETWLANQQVIHECLPMYLRLHAPKLLGFSDGGDGFRRQVPKLIDCLSRYFSARSNKPAWLDVLPQRETSAVRFEKDNAGFEQESLSDIPNFEDVPESLVVRCGDGKLKKLDIGNFEWGYSLDEKATVDPVTMRIERRLTNFGIKYMETWAFLASPDDIDLLKENRIPASASRVRDGLADTTILNAVTFSGETEAYSSANILALEFCKQGGDLLSARYIVTKFATIQAMSPMQTLTLRRVLQSLV